MKNQTKPVIAFILGLLIIVLYPTNVFSVFIGMVLIAIGIIDLAWIIIQPPKLRKIKRTVSRKERRETLQKIKKAVKKRR